VPTILELAASRCKIPIGVSLNISPTVLSESKSILTVLAGDFLLSSYFRHLEVPVYVKKYQNQEDNTIVEKRILDQVAPRWGEEYARLLIRRYPGGMQAGSTRFSYPISKVHNEVMNELDTLISEDHSEIVQLLGNNYYAYLNDFHRLWSTSRQKIEYPNEFSYWVSREVAEWTLTEMVSVTGFALVNEREVYLHD